MTTARCPHCGGQISAAPGLCIWCGSHLTAPVAMQIGDRIRIRNRFKGGHVEEVTVVNIEREGQGIEVCDAQNMLWGYIWPSEVIEVMAGARAAGS